MAVILEIKNLSVESRENKKKLLDNVSFNVAKKSIYALIGPNGSGKSTLAYALMGIHRFRVVSGKIIFQGRDITKLATDKRARMGMSLAFQEPAYFDGIRVEDFLRAGNKSRARDSARNKKFNLSETEAEEVLSLVGLDKKFLNRSVDKTLSGGERKRIELASLIAMRPNLMILDEPDSGLDIIIYKEFYDILDNVRKETGASIILITHRQETTFIADKVGFLYEGKMLYEGNFKGALKEYYRTARRR